MHEIIDKKIGNEVDGGVISDLFEGYVFKIQGGFDRDGFAMKNGVLTPTRKRILMKKGASGYRFHKGWHRTGVRERKLVRGCIVSHEIKILNLKIIKVGNKPIPGLNDVGDETPKRLGPKTAKNVLKEFGLLEIYNKKKQNTEERKTIRYMITKFAPKREVVTANGKKYSKRPKIQRLTTPLRLRRRKVLRKIREDRRSYTEEQKKLYQEIVAKLRKNSKKARKNKSHKK